jgi:thiamine-phosphate pyrophosphorylase
MAGSAACKVDFQLCLVTDRKPLTGGGLVEAVSQAVSGGVDAVVLREKDLGGRGLYELGRSLADTLNGRARLIINDRVDAAMALGAGVHLPGSGLPVKEARRLVGDGALVGLSTHAVEEVKRAEVEGADYVFFGPVYETASKKGLGGPQGLAGLQKAAASVKIPVFAIGGIGPARVAECLEQGAWGVALISYVLFSEDPCEAARNVKKVLERGAQAS